MIQPDNYNLCGKTALEFEPKHLFKLQHNGIYFLYLTTLSVASNDKILMNSKLEIISKGRGCGLTSVTKLLLLEGGGCEKP